MTRDLRTHPPPRARPVADLPADAMLARADDLARRWAVALILARPLDGIGDIPLEDLAREGPSLCAQAIRALQSDIELERLTGQGAPTGREQSAPGRRLGAIAGASDAAAAVDAAEVLRGVLWEALLDELRGPIFDRSSARHVADISDRLAYVCASALAASIGPGIRPEPPSPGLEGDVVLAVPEPAVPGPGPGREPSAQPGAVIVDEHSHIPAPAPRAQPPRARPGTVTGAGRPSERPRSRQESPPPARGVSAAGGRPSSWDGSPPMPAGVSRAEIEIRDERGEGGPAAWIGSIGRQLERFEQDGLPFAVLLVELLDIERLRREEPPAALVRLADLLEDALAGELRGFALGAGPGPRPDLGRAPWSGSLTCQRPGRYWLLAPETDPGGARRLAERLREAVSSCVSYRGTPLEVVLGTAVCPEDGLLAPALAAHADVGLYAARSEARSSIERSPAPVDEPA